MRALETLRRNLPPVLLLQPRFCGTLAAARCLGARGVPVTAAGDTLLGQTRWSRYATRWLEAPAVSDPEALVAWLLDLGSREPGQVLYPTCDDLAWLFALHRRELGRSFRLFSPPVECLEGLLDKRRLHALAREAGLETPATSYPSDQAEAVRAARDLRFPVLIKPRTQVLSLTHSKGVIVDRAEDLPAWFSGRSLDFRHHPMLAARMPEAGHVMLQEYATRSTGVYTLSGFVDRTGMLVARASRKMLQRPSGLGVGLCFESAQVGASEKAGIERLCRAAGYHGAFDVEFLDCGDRRLLIDFNPRFYNQMAFEIARGLPTPWLAYLGALGLDAELAEAARAAGKDPEAHDAAFCNRFAAQHVLFWQVLLGVIPLADERRWRHWYRSHLPLVTDSSDAPGDHVPNVAAIADELASAWRHPRAFLRQNVLARAR